MENEIADGVYWVGVYFKDKGASMNSFLLKDEKTALVDVGPTATQDMVLSNIEGIAEPESIDYVVLTHAGEVDHAGAVQKVLQVCSNAEVYTSELGAMAIPLYGLIQVARSPTIKHYCTPVLTP